MCEKHASASHSLFIIHIMYTIIHKASIYTSHSDAQSSERHLYNQTEEKMTRLEMGSHKHNVWRCMEHKQSTMGWDRYFNCIKIQQYMAKSGMEILHVYN